VSLLKREVSAAPRGLGAARTLGFRIEAYDLAHLSGTNIVGAMAVIQNGSPCEHPAHRDSASGGSSQGEEQWKEKLKLT
jgi:excinuclease UvrABC nuclease subunit